MDPHVPYLPDKEFDQWGNDKLRKLHKDIPPGPFAEQFPDNHGWWELNALTSLYDGGIRQADAEVRRIINQLKERGVFDNTLIVVTSDHGEGFGETSNLRPSLRMVDHKWGIHEVLTHVPLVVKYPMQTSGTRTSKPTSLTQFRKVVNDEINDDGGGFDHNSVITSTYQLLPEDADNFQNLDSINKAIGPWRAVYEVNDDIVTKYAAVGENYDTTATIKIRDAQTSWCSELNERDKVEQTFSQIEPDSSLHSGEKEISKETEERLSELGYI
jgi:hypothetical protein